MPSKRALEKAQELYRFLDSNPKFIKLANAIVELVKKAYDKGRTEEAIGCHTHCKEAVAEEREACAKVAEEMTDGVHIVKCVNVARAIRERGNDAKQEGS